MEPPTKKSKTSSKCQIQEENETKNIMDLNDDCIFTIFEMLPESDICSINFTCKRMQELARNHYNRKHPNEWITIDISINDRGNTDLEFEKNEENKILKYFGKIIPNLRLRCPVRKSDDCIDLGLLYYFLNNECNEKLNQLELDLGTGIELNCTADDEIKKQLSHVEYVKITEAECVQSTYNGIVKYCVNLKKLEIASKSSESYDWLWINYPKLETVVIPWIDQTQPIMNIQKFFERHPQLKDITCEDVHIRKHVPQNFENIQRLAFRVWSCDELHTLIQCLKCNDNNKLIKSFGLKLGFFKENIDHFIGELNEFQPINKLEFHTTFEFPPLEIPQLAQLEELTLNISFLHKFILNSIPGNAPNLKKLELSFDRERAYEASEFRSIVIPFIRELSKLERISFVFKNKAFAGSITADDLVEVENLRNLIPNVSNVEINISYRCESGEVPISTISPGKIITLNYHFKPELTKLNDYFEYSVAEVIFEGQEASA